MKQGVLIPAESLFGQQKPSVPEPTALELAHMGIKFVESEETRLVEIPFPAQWRLVDSVKKTGFHAARNLDVLVEKILKLAGFVGKYSIAIDPVTQTWSAWQKKNQEPEAAEPEPIESIPSPSNLP